MVLIKQIVSWMFVNFAFSHWTKLNTDDRVD